jgi:aconitate hydratase
MIGMLPLTFVDPKDYDRVGGHDRVDILGLTSFAPGKNLTLRVHKVNGEVRPLPCPCPGPSLPRRVCM